MQARNVSLILLCCVAGLAIVLAADSVFYLKGADSLLIFVIGSLGVFLSIWGGAMIGRGIWALMVSPTIWLRTFSFIAVFAIVYWLAIGPFSALQDHCDHRYFSAWYCF